METVAIRKWKREWVFPTKHSCPWIKWQRLAIKHHGSQFWDSLWSPSVVEAQMCQQKNTSSREHHEHLQSVWLDSNPGSTCIDTLLHLSYSNSIICLRVMSTLQKGDRSSEMLRVLPKISHTGRDKAFLTPELTLQNLYTYLWRACVRFLLEGKWRGKLGKHLMTPVSSKHRLASSLEPSDYKIDGTLFFPPKLPSLDYFKISEFCLPCRIGWIIL